MELGRLFEVILYVRDMQAMVDFYHGKLGIGISYPPGLDDYSGQDWVALNADGNTLALHSGGEQPAGTPPRFGFLVTDINQAHRDLSEAGVQCGEPRSPAPGVFVVDCKDPEDNGFFVEQSAHHG